jgi:hypothetical protein
MRGIVRAGLAFRSVHAQHRRHPDRHIGLALPWLARRVLSPKDAAAAGTRLLRRDFWAVEINGTFYSLQRPEYFERWAAEVPDNFVFASKGPRFVTHNKKLTTWRRRSPTSSPAAPEARAKARALPAGSCRRCSASTGSAWRASSSSCRATPRRSPASPVCTTTASPAAPAWSPTPNRRVRHCLEIRHKSFEDPRFIELLREHDIGLVCADTVDWPLPDGCDL